VQIGTTSKRLEVPYTKYTMLCHDVKPGHKTFCGINKTNMTGLELKALSGNP
jgi:hypothetical protein